MKGKAIIIESDGNRIGVSISKEHLKKDDRLVLQYNWAIFALLQHAADTLDGSSLQWLERRIVDTCTQNIINDEMAEARGDD